MAALCIYAPERDAGALSKQLGLPIAGTEPEGLHLRYDPEGLWLSDGILSIRGSFAALLPRLREQNLNGELLVRAAKRKSFSGTPTAIDATAGLGEDALLLAAAGFDVTLYERNAIIAALLRDTLERAASTPGLEEITARMHLVEGDSVAALRAAERPPDVIYLDPMFPARRKSGLIGKKLQLLQALEAPCDDENALLQAAIGARPKKIIIKRPLKGPELAGRKPSYTLRGRAVRYDCIVP